MKIAEPMLTAIGSMNGEFMKTQHESIPQSLKDPQQIYDESIQMKETDVEEDKLDEISLDPKNFAADFYEYSAEFHDNENGHAGADQDFGTRGPAESLSTVNDETESALIADLDALDPEETLTAKDEESRDAQAPPRVRGNRPERSINV